MPNVMSKFLHLGMPLFDIIKVITFILGIHAYLLSKRKVFIVLVALFTYFPFDKAVTQTPAEVMKRQDEHGSLTIGTEADVTIIKLVNASDTLLGDQAEDSDGNSRTLKQRIVPIAVFRAGKFYAIAN